MNITVTAKTNAKINEVLKINKNHYKVSVTTTPIDGKANLAIIKLLSKHLNIPKSQIALIRGKKSKLKVFKII